MWQFQPGPSSAVTTEERAHDIACLAGRMPLLWGKCGLAIVEHPEKYQGSHLGARHSSALELCPCKRESPYEPWAALVQPWRGRSCYVCASGGLQAQQYYLLPDTVEWTSKSVSVGEQPRIHRQGTIYTTWYGRSRARSNPVLRSGGHMHAS